MIVKAKQTAADPAVTTDDPGLAGGLWHVWDRVEAVQYPSSATCSVPLCPIEHTGMAYMARSMDETFEWFRKTREVILQAAIRGLPLDRLRSPITGELCVEEHWLFALELREFRPENPEEVKLKDWTKPQPYSYITFLKRVRGESYNEYHVVFFSEEAYICNDQGDTVHGIRLRSARHRGGVGR